MGFPWWEPPTNVPDPREHWLLTLLVAFFSCALILSTGSRHCSPRHLICLCCTVLAGCSLPMRVPSKCVFFIFVTVLLAAFVYIPSTPCCIITFLRDACSSRYGMEHRAGDRAYVGHMCRHIARRIRTLIVEAVPAATGEIGPALCGHHVKAGVSLHPARCAHMRTRVRETSDHALLREGSDAPLAFCARATPKPPALGEVRLVWRCEHP